MAIIRTEVLHVDTTVPGNGIVDNVEAFASLALHVQGTSTARNITFQGSVDGINFVNIQGLNITTLAMATTITTTNEIWQFDVSGLKGFRAVVNSVSGGNVVIVANRVA